MATENNGFRLRIAGHPERWLKDIEERKVKHAPIITRLIPTGEVRGAVKQLHKAYEVFEAILERQALPLELRSAVLDVQMQCLDVAGKVRAVRFEDMEKQNLYFNNISEKVARSQKLTLTLQHALLEHVNQAPDDLIKLTADMKRRFTLIDMSVKRWVNKSIEREQDGYLEPFSEY